MIYSLKAKKTDLKFFENIIKTPAPDPWRPAQLNWWQVRQFSKVATFIHLKIFLVKENICTQVKLKCYQLLWCERQLLVQGVGEHQSSRFRGKQVHDDDQIDGKIVLFFHLRNVVLPSHPYCPCSEVILIFNLTVSLFYLGVNLSSHCCNQMTVIRFSKFFGKNYLNFFTTISLMFYLTIWCCQITGKMFKPAGYQMKSSHPPPPLWNERE